MGIGTPVEGAGCWKSIGELSEDQNRESHWFGGRWGRYNWCPNDNVRLSRKDGTYPIKQSSCETVSNFIP